MEQFNKEVDLATEATRSLGHTAGRGNGELSTFVSSVRQLDQVLRSFVELLKLRLDEYSRGDSGGEV
jgi:hypothetical protein